MAKKKTSRPLPQPTQPMIRFPAISGVQSGRQYWVAMMSLRVVPQLATPPEDLEEISPEYRAQRLPTPHRGRAIASYLCTNPRDYVLPALTMSIGEIPEFVPLVEEFRDIGTISFPVGTSMLVNDGQHRVLGIRQTLKDMPELGDETVPVAIYFDAGLRRSQQMFTDLNKHTVKPSKAISILFDHRDVLAIIVRDVAEEVLEFKGMIDFERPNIPAKGIKLHSLNNLYDATKCLLADVLLNSKAARERASQQAISFWAVVARSIESWGRAKRRETHTCDLRGAYIHSHGVALPAIVYALRSEGRDIEKVARRLDQVQWDRTAVCWQGRCVEDGRIVKNNRSIRRTANEIKRQLGLSLTASDKPYEG